MNQIYHAVTHSLSLSQSISVPQKLFTQQFSKKTLTPTVDGYQRLKGSSMVEIHMSPTPNDVPPVIQFTGPRLAALCK